MNKTAGIYVISSLMLLASVTMLSAKEIEGKLVKVGDGYAATSVNTAVFRGSSIAAHGDTQYIAFYDADGYVTLGKRAIGSDDWTLHTTRYKGNVSDAHNVISIGIDGDGYLHASFDHHGHPLRYARSIYPGSLELGEMTVMTGSDEQDVTYPEFYTLAGGDLIFAYRSGASGRGNLILNRYDVKSKKWSRVHDVLIDGEGERNAYWQMFADPKGSLHLSWVWRETWLVETNHDLCYARSDDGGLTWKRSDGSLYQLPITMSTSEMAWKIPQNSELINQTGMTADADGNPFIATYWRDQDSEVPQYRLVWHDGKEWRMTTVGERKTPFSLSGGGTKMIPIARPRIVSDGKKACYIFRDEERGSRVSVAYTPDIRDRDWTVTDMTDFSVDAWEPSHDLNLWNDHRKLNVFVQASHQGDGEKVAETGSKTEPVYVLEIDF
ncbi:MAG: BNR repeat-containing protein [Muribaculaceae bacterium]|nr:BNR repeat-containing protein [Muribaculaceae bacterium]